MSGDAAREERIVQNEVAFRAANDSLKATFEDADEARGEVYPFLCECGDRRCTEVVLLTLQAYESVRSHSTRFVIRPGHKQLESERQLDSGDGYEIIEKTGTAADLVLRASQLPEQT